ncbi:hypothetical protein [Mycolicibacterium sp.]|uniref:hypothetical protein n=2 Tax=Mycolicibacterium sp. TaxID=2320850 RepID=UPI003D0F81AB
MSDSQLSMYNTTIRRDGGKPRIRLREITLRQIGHMEADLTMAEKMHWLRELAAAGVAETIVWGADTDADELVRRKNDEGIRIGIGFYGKSFFRTEWMTTLEKAQKCGADFVCLNGRGAEFALRESGWTREQMLEVSTAAVAEAKDRELTISMGLYGFPQTVPEFVTEFGAAMGEAGADRIYCPDSLGVAGPQAMAAVIAMLRSATDAVIEAHCHNDFGLGVANSIACVEAGADYVEVFVNGMDPERCGIAALDEVATALEKLYDVDTGIDLTRLHELSRLHERLTGMAMAANKPIVGDRAFNYRVAPVQGHGEARHDTFYGSPRVTPFDPADVGNARHFMLGKYSGANEVSKSLQDWGLQVADDRLDLLVELVRRHGASSRATLGRDELAHLAAVVS